MSIAHMSVAPGPAEAAAKFGWPLAKLCAKAGFWPMAKVNPAVSPMAAAPRIKGRDVRIKSPFKSKHMNANLIFIEEEAHQNATIKNGRTLGKSPTVMSLGVIQSGAIRNQ
jgi:hypothetical protein